MVCFGTDLEHAFQLFITCRANNGNKLTAEQVQLLREELCGLSSDPAERMAIVKKATVSNWKSFYPITRAGKKQPKEQPKQNKNKFSDYPHRDYDYDAIKKRLIGD